MNIKKELENHEDLVVAGRLAIAYALLEMAPYTREFQDGSPSQMAAYVIKSSKDRGNYAKLKSALL